MVSVLVRVTAVFSSKNEGNTRAVNTAVELCKQKEKEKRKAPGKCVSAV